MPEMKLNVQRGFSMGTRISSINVPPELRVKKTSGLNWLDHLLGKQGGFTPTTTMMLTGTPGAGKSTLLRQLANAMDASGHIVLMNTGEESLYQAKMACERLRLPNDFMVGEETMLPKVLEYLDNVKKAHKGKQIVYLQDSLQTLDDGKYVDKNGDSRGTNGKTPERCTDMIVDWTQRNFGITVFIGQVTKSGDFAGTQHIKHAIDAHMHLSVDDDEKSDTYGSLLAQMTKHRWGPTGAAVVLNMTKRGIFAAMGQRFNANDEDGDDDLDAAAQ
jgi:DNA repair protein RadA/Sms